jgi:hypothetical protein
LDRQLPVRLSVFEGQAHTASSLTLGSETVFGMGQATPLLHIALHAF